MLLQKTFSVIATFLSELKAHLKTIVINDIGTMGDPV